MGESDRQSLKNNIRQRKVNREAGGQAGTAATKA